MDESKRRPPIRAALLRENRAIVAMAVLLFVFLALTALARSDLLLSWDRTVTFGVQSRRSTAVDGIAVGISLLGSWPVLTAAAFLGAAACALGRRPLTALLVVATLLAFPLNFALKAAVGRPRPADGVAVLSAVSGLSFPSGHSMTAAAVLGFLAFLAWTHVRQRSLRTLLAAGLATLAMLIGLTRVYLGAHWLSDVVGGWTVGLCLALLLAEVHKARARRELSGPD
ncbi:MAG: phosphatase PAP2 family protein [Actinomycetota bacterium]